MYPKNTEYVYSYFESRKGAKFDLTPFFGLHYLLKQFRKIDNYDIEHVRVMAAVHFGQATAKTLELYRGGLSYNFDKYYKDIGQRELFNIEGWKYVMKLGYLPIRIKAVPEGTLVPTNNVMMTVENTDPKAWWITNYFESFLTHVWYPSTVCALSRSVKVMLKEFGDKTGSNDMLDFKLQDFGYRGVSSDESADLGGAAHLVNFKGTDTFPAIDFIRRYYSNGSAFDAAAYEGIGYSVPATEHSICTALGEDGEPEIVGELLTDYPTGILSVVADSYDINRFVEEYVGKKFKERILARDGIFVVRPDSVTPELDTPEKEMVWILDSLWSSFGGRVNEKGYKVINDKIRVLWGDGIDIVGIRKILEAITQAGFSIDCIACFGMGGGLLQKVNRDTQRFAFKSSAQCRDGVWHDVYKRPRDVSKESKRGRLKLINDTGTLITVPETDPRPDVMETVYEDGKILVKPTFSEIRERAAL